MATVGLIGGIAPASTADYYQRIIASYRQHVCDDSYPSIFINSISLTVMLRMVEEDRLEELTAYLCGELRRLRAAGADFGLLASNTPHLVFDDLQRRSPLPLVSIVEAARAAAADAGYKKIGLLGTRFTMSAGFYPAVFTRAGIDVIPPKPDEQEYVHAKYMGELVQADFRPDTRSGFVDLIARMRQRDGVEAVLLAGTELPLLLRPATPAVPFLDTTAIHVAAVVVRLLSQQQ